MAYRVQAPNPQMAYARMEFTDKQRNPVDVFKDPNLTEVHGAIVFADSSGIFPLIYIDDPEATDIAIKRFDE